jgi:hypothetical protein
VDGAACSSVGRDHEVRELRTLVAFPERRYAERIQDGLVERDARAGIAHADLDVVEDDARPVSVHAHVAKLPQKSLTGERVFV